jgi:hypothetical protein
MLLTPFGSVRLIYVQTSCLTEIFFVEAMERARALDQHLADTGETVGPLHGLPVSLKVLVSTRCGMRSKKADRSGLLCVGWPVCNRRLYRVSETARPHRQLGVGELADGRWRSPVLQNEHPPNYDGKCDAPESSVLLTDRVRPPTRRTTSLDGLLILTTSS